MVIAIIGILVALLLPAIMAARETARRHQCMNHLSQIMIATENYAASHGVLPPGTIDAAGPVRNRPVGYHLSWAVQILPFLEQRNVFDQIDFSVGAYHTGNAAMRRIVLPVLRCPTSRTNAGSNYAGCHHDLEAPIDVDNHGVLFLNSAITWKDLADGRAQTIFFGERVSAGLELGWISGTRSTLRNTGTPINRTSAAGGPLATFVDLGVVLPTDRPGGLSAPSATAPLAAQPAASAAPPIWQFPGGDNFDLEHEYQPAPMPGGAAPALIVGGFESQHSTGAQFAFGDGSVRFLSEDIDNVTYQRLGHRADGYLLDDRF